jgi:glycerol kinase
MAYQTRDVLEVMQAEARLMLPHLKVDGGAAANAMLLQFQADQLGVPVRRPVVAETTASRSGSRARGVRGGTTGDDGGSLLAAVARSRRDRRITDGESSHGVE